MTPQSLEVTFQSYGFLFLHIFLMLEDCHMGGIPWPIWWNEFVNAEIPYVGRRNLAYQPLHSVCMSVPSGKVDMPSQSFLTRQLAGNRAANWLRRFRFASLAKEARGKADHENIFRAPADSQTTHNWRRLLKSASSSHCPWSKCSSRRLDDCLDYSVTGCLLSHASQYIQHATTRGYLVYS